MPKRKRGEKDNNEGEERHAKIRVQEVDNTTSNVGQDGASGPPRASTADAIQISNAEQDENLRKEARKKAKHERRALKKAEKNINRTAKDAVLERDEGDIKAAINGTRDEGDRITKSYAQGGSGKSETKREIAVKDTATKGRRSSSMLRSKWTMSDPVGGRMLDLDPIYARDEQHLLVAYSTFVAVYSAATSLLVRRLPLRKAGVITGVMLDSCQDHCVYISTTSEELSKWNWTEGQHLRTWHMPSRNYVLSATSEDLSDEADDVVYTLNKRDAREWILSAHRFHGKREATKANTQTLFKHEDGLTGLQVLLGGKVIVTTSRHKLIIGTTDSSASEDVDKIKYVWRIVESPEWIRSFDVRSRPSDRTSKKHVSKGSFLEAIDIVIGGLKGTIYVYDDLLHKLVRKESAGKAGNLETLASRNLHWHRNAVMTVKWSLDGNYIISGGQETVLVIWQLETGQKQHLPHLGAAIESIVISPTGSSYAVRLADNSAMILSTSELRPTFSIAGIQMPTMSKSHRAFPHVPSVDVPRESVAWPESPQYPACIALSGTDRLSLAVPPSSMSGSYLKVSLNASYLQTCDITSGHQFSRQALTRTKVTTLNMGPESNTIEEPNVTHIQISHDGQWLATIDEWTPPKQDVVSLVFDDEAAELEQTTRQEIYLKFWSWNSSDKAWELVSRIDNPHAVDSRDPLNSGGVLDLASNPSTVAFSTIGRDGSVKMWVPMVRMRRELTVKGKHGLPLTSWRCQHTTSTAMFSSSPTTTPEAKLAYGSDGSLLAAAPFAASPPSSSIFLLDTSAGLIRIVYNSLSSGPIRGIGIVNKYLLVLSHHLLSWDLVSNELHYNIDLSLPTPPSKAMRTSILAVNHIHENFAFTLPERTKSGKVSTKLAIMDATSPKPLFVTTIPTTITNLLPAISKNGFYSLDTNAEIRTFTPQTSLPGGLLTPSTDTEAVPSSGINRVFGSSQTSNVRNNKAKGLLNITKDTIYSDRPSEAGDHDSVVVSTDQLAEAFDPGASALSLPPVGELFERVARLYGGRVDF